MTEMEQWRDKRAQELLAKWQWRDDGCCYIGRRSIAVDLVEGMRSQHERTIASIHDRMMRAGSAHAAMEIVKSEYQAALKEPHTP